MDAAAPFNASEVIVTVLLAPTAAVSNVAVPAQVTASPSTAPWTAQFDSVAAMVPSYTLLATTGAAVTDSGVIVAVDVALVEIRL